MAIKLEVIIPTNRWLNDDERDEVIWAVHDAIRTKIAEGKLNHLNLMNRPIVQQKSNE